MPPSDSLDGGPPLSEGEAEDLLRCICFKTGPPRALGVELEWFVHDLLRPHRPVSSGRLHSAYTALHSLDLRSSLSLEPGGQLELSSPPAASLSACVTAVSADLAAVRTALAALGLSLTGSGTDPWLPRRERILREPRYDAMETYLDRWGASGRSMMRDSASIQVCLDSGLEEPGPLGFARRWRLAHLLGPVLVASFANSPVLHGRRSGMRSTRQSLWTDIDPMRGLAPPMGREPRSAWAAHVLDTPVMCVRAAKGPWEVPKELTFRQWLRGPVDGLRAPVRADLDYHLTTLFPPVRPRGGHLELRMVDAQPGEDGWIVPLAVTSALFDDPEAAEAAYRVLAPLTETAGPLPPPRDAHWRAAIRDGPDALALHEAAVACFGLALESLHRSGAPAAVRDAVAGFHERYVLRRRCPADDQQAPPPTPTAPGPAAPAPVTSASASGKEPRP
ncbi:ergothioneine biosynthesis glutamate--cysteine ligase EgtA [Streptomyces sp. MUM 203J]|uniref:ergothioneine biosynthesis glutamate--cysteine ligase EgtA n=1 Tax=Streptomyces sp. MUM 203J TaxID=2791990 RepID=UPI001F046A13|nr:ergothioneine biosynthesis glutamate--cysteine ligase EgtA [Streptomyces sp. MUM 203J]MCH0541577.1 ergothioneine biosynthesis glutamate--cysteine ligase EgtA [Streptomyces sp. MUM 203J]